MCVCVFGGRRGRGAGGLITGLCAVASPLVSGCHVVSDINVTYDGCHSDGGALLPPDLNNIGLEFKVE